jgi:hypothetical protein
MSRYNEELKLKLAWQSALEQRTCPDSDILYAEIIDDNLRKHLSYCDVCRENRAMQLEEKTAWQGLLGKMSEQAIKPARETEKQEGQVWTLKKTRHCCQEDGRYFQPPAVLLLGKAEKNRKTVVWNAAQLYEDKRLMAGGDIPLDDIFGFAEAWNCYELNEELLDLCFGCVKQDELKLVIAASVTSHEPAQEGSILSFFRSMEIEVGKYVTLSAVDTLVDELSNNEVFLQNIIGSLAEVYQKLSGLRLPEFANSLIDLISGTTDPNGISPVVASTSTPLSVNIVIRQIDGTIAIRTVGATLTDNNWEDGDYYVAGKLNEIQNEELFLAASLNVNGKVVCECQSNIEKDSPYFDIVFSNVAKEAGTIENLKFILVRP